MDREDAIAVQLEQELATEPEDASAAAARAERLDIHTGLPGIVQGFDRQALTVTVRPAIQRLWIDAGFVTLPDLVNVPVQFPRFGNFVIIGDVAPNDEGYVHFAERAIDNWHHAGGVQEPAEFRLHDLSDGFFAPGYWSKPEAAKVTGGAPAGALEIRTLDGSTVLRLDPDGSIYIGAKAGAQPIPLGDALHTILAAIKTHTHAVSGAVASASVELAAPILNWDVRSSKGKVK